MSHEAVLDRNFMYRAKKRPQKRKYAVLDLETKRLDTQDKGFERCFMSCFYDGERPFEVFRNGDIHKGKSYTDCFWLDQDGCIDKMMRHIFGLRTCKVCEVKESEYRFGTCGECIKARKRYQSDQWLIGSHNGGNFDNLFILGWLRKHANLFGFEIISTMGRILTLSVKPRGKLESRDKREGWTFVDTFALLPISLKEIGKAFCANEKAFQKMSFDLDLEEDNELWGEYNLQDCIVLHTALQRFSNLIEKLGGAVAITAAGTAMNVFRMKYQRKPIHRNAHFPECDGRCHRVACEIKECASAHPSERVCHGCMHDFVREGFFGGRTEVFRLSGKNCFYYDINSSYPTSMLGDMPVGAATVLPEKTSLRMLQMMGKDKIGFVEAIVEVPLDTYLPVLPYRWVNPDTHDTKLIFPVGTLYGVWNWIELAEALEAGATIKAIGRSVWYKKGKIFDKMIRTLYAYRNKICTVCRKNVQKNECKCDTKTWDAGLDYCSKLMMNSTFGKFGTNPIREQMIFPTEHDDYVIPEHAKLPPAELFDSGCPLSFQKILENDFIIPQIAAHITAEARVRVYRGLKSVRDRGGDIIYTDTDACMGTLPVWPEGPELGQWKLEEKHFDVEVPLPKTYMLRFHEGGCEGSDPNCKGCSRLHKPDCNDFSCDGCKAPITVKMKGVPKIVQRPDVFDHLTKWGTGECWCTSAVQCRIDVRAARYAAPNCVGTKAACATKAARASASSKGAVTMSESCPCGSDDAFKHCHGSRLAPSSTTSPECVQISAMAKLGKKTRGASHEDSVCPPLFFYRSDWKSGFATGDIRIDEKTKKIIQVHVAEGNEASKGIIHFDRLTKFRTMFAPVKAKSMDRYGNTIEARPEGLYSPVERPASKSIRTTYDKRIVSDAPPGHPDYGNTYPHIVRDPITLKEARAKRSSIDSVELADAAE
jgi:hypothetical protein